MAPAPSIAIVGSGLSGLALSLFLNRLIPDATIKIYEVRPSTHTSTSGTINLTPNALRVLDHLGIYKSLIPQGFNFDNLTLMNHQFDILVSIPIANIAEFEYQSLRLERRLLHATLLRKVEEQAKIEILYDSKCTSITESDGGVTVILSNGTTVNADLLIACDGIHSTVRKSFMKDPKDHDPKYTGQVSMGGFISTAEIDKYNVKKVPYPMMMFGPESDHGANFMIWPYNHSGDETTFFTTLSKPDEEEDWNSYAGDKDKLKAILSGIFTAEDSPWNEMVKKTVELSDPERFRFWPFYIHNVPEKFHSEKGRVIMIGDAAHAMPPSGGQGGAMAFEDAETLAYSLAHMYSTSKEETLGAPECLEVLGKWSEHRLRRIQAIQEMNKRMADMRKGSSGSTSGLMFTVKVWVIWVLGLLGVLKRARRAVNNYNGRNEMINVFGESIAKLE
ncbi:hypothetical protein ABW20_dc0103235 [Dactylellina cionopaga]|nr:hypothetical protein ABW20_dc0103235 [Dactylellina cionopaga]